MVVLVGCTAFEAQACHDYDNDGWTDCAGDCDDWNAWVYPCAWEYCDNVDNDCDGVIDEGCDYCHDDDGDGWTDCDGDCHDWDATIYPGAPELCDGKDNDCDGWLLWGEVDWDGDGWKECDGDCDDMEPCT